MPSRRPNILLVMTDQQKADTLALYGNRIVRTPALDELAAAGVVVDGHVCNYPACTPARATVHTGRYPHTTRVRALHIHLSPREITLPQVLRAAGYRTGLVGKNHVFPDGGVGSVFRDGALALRDWPERLPELHELGKELAAAGELPDRRDLFDTWFQADHFGPQGAEFAPLREFATQGWLWRSHAAVATAPFPAESCTSAVLGERAADFIRAGAGGKRPWFLWLSFPDPHNPYLAPEPYASTYAPEEVDLPPHDSLEGKPERQRVAHRMSGMHRATEDELRRAVAMQYGMVSFVDDGLRTALAALRESGQERDTIVVFTTDHGGYVGDHGGMHKSVAFYDALIRLPFVLSWPGTLAPRRLEHGFLEQVDLLPTLLELAELPVPPGVQGRSAASALAGTGELRPEAYAECGERRDPVGLADLPFEPDGPLDARYFGWDGFVEGWWGQGKMIRTEEWKYCWYANGDEELYDLAADPDELANLAAEPAQRERCSAFRDRLLAFCVETEDALPLHSWHVRLDDVLTGNFPWPD
ncbi:MAG TPA: sulfatase-like hydrolase/transferase [Gaiellaceae bacterium]|nr:sulfatase-like hydrolase/transferase [Gaiellaceae bacterium]